MLSILIPTYEQDISELVNTLHQQCLNEAIQFEILAQDDASNEVTFEAFKSAIDLTFFSWERNLINLGRSGNRNQLAAKAKYDVMLFIDGDSMVKNPGFIKAYLDNRDHQFVYGGTDYPAKQPMEKNYYLHWKYATSYEALSVSQRFNNPYNSFHSNNFLIQKATFQKSPFDESILKYGYEDHLFAHNFRLLEVPIFHISNPVFHNGLETNLVFLEKTKNAVENLSELYHNGKINDGGLIKKYEQLKKRGQLKFISKILSWRRPAITDNLMSAKPKMINFQLYKLDLFIQYVRRFSN
jgi:glycosyltransferase involved in cell wall biosynthesis